MLSDSDANKSIHFEMTDFPIKWYVRVQCSGELHTVTAYGKTRGEAKLNGMRIAERLLGSAVEVQWVKEYNLQSGKLN